MKNQLLLKNGRMLDTHTGEIFPADLIIQDGRVERIGKDLPVKGMETMDLAGKLMIPGLIDMHIHLREPGFEEKETIATGSRAAARGGYTTVACMPNTRPVIDTPDKVRQVWKINIAEGCGVRVLPIAAITRDSAGEVLTDMAGLKEAGAVAISDDGVGVQCPRMMKDAMRLAHEAGLPVVAHCEEEDLLVPGACVHDGSFARKHGLPGIPGESEAIHVGRDILLAEDTGVHYHVCHISAKSSVRLVREAKSRGQWVTAEVTPHHLLLCEEDIPGPDPLFKMNPPLRSAKDREALIEGLKDGTIDMIATDHAPHTANDKAKDIREAPFGIVGLETAFPLLYTHLVQTGELTLAQLVDRMSRIPAERFELPGGVLKEGGIADLTVIDLEEERPVEPERFASKGKNTPFAGWKAKGWPVVTLVEGKVVWEAASQV
ncbi:MAG: dihydroorotase [Firmicutes bacterium]|uniref:Dihydroorotase n=1 Tax=Melghirimyces thermohalophilus TaxID=1236220 RepID=A0A1G6HS84_9BACL|nr:dihydroorotase [Melghirimyces thermohalophilus]MDA8354443.1 dihydroorotase [Bacillota bacterium]SDB97092.1 dihydroorotase [Melghirimyces thermohalophilus]